MKGAEVGTIRDKETLAFFSSSFGSAWCGMDTARPGGTDEVEPREMTSKACPFSIMSVVLSATRASTETEASSNGRT